MILKTYFYPETCLTSKAINDIEFIGQSLPFYNSVRDYMERSLSPYENLLLRHEAIDNFLSVHNRDYLDSICKLAQDIELSEEDTPSLSLECAGLQYALPAYSYSLGGYYQAIEEMKTGILNRAYIFSMPSHHSYTDKGHGYCLLNTLAAAVRYAQSQGFQNILIIDWDIHHGDGTQSIFENDKSVFQISIHNAVDLYMSAVGATMLGTTDYGRKVGQCNIPVLDSHFDQKFWEDCEMTGLYYRSDNCKKQFEIELNNLPFKADLVFIFDGHDSHKDDCGDSVTHFSTQDFVDMTELVLSYSMLVDCPVISSIGGGYNFETHCEAALAHCQTLANF